MNRSESEDGGDGYFVWNVGEEGAGIGGFGWGGACSLLPWWGRCLNGESERGVPPLG